MSKKKTYLQNKFHFILTKQTPQKKQNKNNFINKYPNARHVLGHIIKYFGKSI